MGNPFIWVMLISALLFLGTAGHLITNIPTLAEMFGKRRRDAHDGEVIVDRRSEGHGASHTTMWASLALHVLGIIGLVVSTLGLAGMVFKRDPALDGAPAEVTPLPVDGGEGVAPTGGTPSAAAGAEAGSVVTGNAPPPAGEVKQLEDRVAPGGPAQPATSGATPQPGVPPKPGEIPGNQARQ